jgi:hypothetical protein
MSDFAPMTPEQIREIAAKHKCEAIVAAPDELQFDLDTDSSLSQFAIFFDWLSKTYSGKPIMSGWKSKNGREHRVIQCSNFSSLSVESRIAMQAMGGSDARREYASLHCHLAGSTTPIVLFKPLTESRPS